LRKKFLPKVLKSFKRSAIIEENGKFCERGKRLKTARKTEKLHKSDVKNGEIDVKKTAREVCYIALFVGVMTVCSWFALFVGSVPVTFQTFGICLTAGLLGGKRGFIAVAAYIALGLCGVPVFAGFTGGIAKLATPTGGYILGFLFAAPIIGVASDRNRLSQTKKSGWRLAIFCIIGLLVCYVVGMAWFILFMVHTADGVSVSAAFLTCVGPYVPFDFLKIGVAVPLVLKVKKYIRYK
jgi:biotin transport system substrate-specific component